MRPSLRAASSLRISASYASRSCSCTGFAGADVVGESHGERPDAELADVESQFPVPDSRFADAPFLSVDFEGLRDCRREFDRRTVARLAEEFVDADDVVRALLHLLEGHDVDLFGGGYGQRDPAASVSIVPSVAKVSRGWLRNLAATACRCPAAFVAVERVFDVVDAEVLRRLVGEARNVGFGRIHERQTQRIVVGLVRTVAAVFEY